MLDQSDRRREERQEVDWIGVIRLPDGIDHPCSIKDVSPSGLKLCVAADQELPESFMVKVVGRQLVFRVHQAWRKQHFVGVMIDKIAKLPASPPPPLPAEAPAPAPAPEPYTRLGSRGRYESSY